MVWFTSTQGGGAPETAASEPVAGYGNGFGQVWGYDPATETLRVVFQSPDQLTMELPDNITTSPRGTLVVCEDGPADNFLRGLTTDGELFDIALNAIEGRRGDEFAGSTFSPDGYTLFVNIQSDVGMTFAIWGPWEEIGV
jgi:uncharacterized protein